jgi:transposase-like protein
MAEKDRGNGQGPVPSPGAAAAGAEGAGGATDATAAPQSDLSEVKRWTASRKQEAVLRLLRGEPLDAVSRELGIEMHRLAQWRQMALTGMEAALNGAGIS